MHYFLLVNEMSTRLHNSDSKGITLIPDDVVYFHRSIPNS